MNVINCQQWTCVGWSEHVTILFREFPARRLGGCGCVCVEFKRPFSLLLYSTLPMMDIDRPLDDIIKKRNKGGRQQQQQQRRSQQKNQRGNNAKKQSNKNQNKNAGGNGRQRRNDKLKNGNNVNLGVSNKSKKSIGKASAPRPNTNLSSRLVYTHSLFLTRH